MKSLPLLVLLMCTWVLAPSAAFARPQSHVRIVLDTSQSMVRNDSKRLAALSALLFYDLARPNLSEKDTFRIFAFHPHWSWSGPDASPPAELGPIIEPRVLGSSADTGRIRGAFADEIRKIPYNAAMTYYYPGLQAALKDLGAPEGPSATRVIVLLTDGVPEPATKDKEKDLLKSVTLPAIEAARVRLFVLAFGPAARETAYLQDVFGAQKNGSLLIDNTGEDLPHHMAEIFSRAFGYTVDPPKDLSSPQDFVLAEDKGSPRSALVVFQLDPHAPDPKVSSPPGWTPNRDSVTPEKGEEVGAAYEVQWIHQPAAQKPYRVSVSPGTKTKGFVLRPSVLDVEIRPEPPHKSLRTMAGTDFPLGILVKPVLGATGSPGDVQVTYNEAGERRPAQGSSLEFSWVGNSFGPPTGGSPIPEGLLFVTGLKFENHPPSEDQDFYLGHVEVQVKRGESMVVEKVKEQAFSVEVYHHVHIGVTPSRAAASAGALDKNEQGCTELRMIPDERTRLPHPTSPSYRVKAITRKTLLTGPLTKAEIFLDGEPLETDSSGLPLVKDWSVGKPRLRADLFDGKRHEICLKAGKPTVGGTVSVPVDFVFAEPGYEDFPNVMEGFTLEVSFKAPSIVEKWGPYALLFGIPLLLALSAWYLRHKPALPDDLRAAVGTPGGPLSPQALGEGALWRKLLGFVVPKPLYAPGGDRTLGWVVPVDDDLYWFRAASGMLSTTEPVGVEGATTKSSVLEGQVEVHRVYEVGSEGQSYCFRVEFGK